jgi:hypothetical protein
MRLTPTCEIVNSLILWRVRGHDFKPHWREGSQAADKTKGPPLSARPRSSYFRNNNAASAREVKATSEIFPISMDQKGVLMRKAELREVTRKAAQE